MLVRTFLQAPQRLPLWWLAGGVVVAVGLRLSDVRPWGGVLELQAPVAGLWLRCGGSFVVLVLALLLALCVALALGLGARRWGRGCEKAVALFGQALAAFPVPVLAWGFVALWTGRLGLPVETLMPAELPRADVPWFVSVARGLWQVLAPALLLAVPLTGELLQGVVADGSSVRDLSASLKARGVRPQVQRWRHHLIQLLAVLRGRLLALVMVAAVYLVAVEDVLRFMGWGGWVAQALRAGDGHGLAWGVLVGSGLLALTAWSLCGLPQSPAPDGKQEPRWLWQPWVLWCVGVMGVPQWHEHSWLVLGTGCLIWGVFSGPGSQVRVRGQAWMDAARVCGASPFAAWWRHVGPLQGRAVLAWGCRVCGQALLWMLLVCALQPKLVTRLPASLAELARPLVAATAQDAAHLLADPSAMLLGGSIVAVAALFLLQISRIIHPRIP